jgi:bifunctional non-homologous end joining protein LigD
MRINFSGKLYRAVAYHVRDSLLVACADLGVEGIIAKRATSTYRPGWRSQDWVKLKTAQWRAENAGRRRPDQRAHTPHRRWTLLRVPAVSHRRAHAAEPGNGGR